MSQQRMRAVPLPQPRALGLVRVSKERDGMVSPEVQRNAITDYAAARGYQVSGWLEGLDESGSRARSAWWPRLEQAVGEVEAGTYDVIVVWKFSRVARNRLRWATAVDRVEAAGGRIESATEQIDTTTSTGRFTRGMLAELQAFEAERIGEVWREIHARRVREGKPATGKPKYGYVYDRVQKLHVPDPDTGPILVNLYRRYVAGESMYALMRWLNGHGHKTINGNVWSDITLRRVLDAGFATGRFRYKGDLVDGVHEPLIDDKLWQAYLDGRARRRAAPARRERSPYVLSGLVVCARCGGPMNPGLFGHDRKPKYRCRNAHVKASCTGGYVMAHYLEREVLEHLQLQAGDVERRREARAAARGQRSSAAGERRRLERELVRAEEALGRLAVQDAQRPLPRGVYEASYAELAGQHARLQEALEEAGRRERVASVRPDQVAQELVAGWDEMPVPYRRKLLDEVIAGVVVLTGRPRATVWVAPSY